MQDYSELTDYELGWVVGFLEGEGCFGLAGGRYPNLQCANTDLNALERLRACFGGNIHGPQIRDGRKPIWQWSLRGEAGARVMSHLMPYLSERRQQAVALAIDTYEARPNKRHRRKPKEPKALKPVNSRAVKSKFMATGKL